MESQEKLPADSPVLRSSHQIRKLDLDEVEITKDQIEQDDNDNEMRTNRQLIGLESRQNSEPLKQE